MEVIKEYRKELITGITAGFLLYFLLKFLFPLFSPFFLAYLTIYAVYPFLYRVENKCKINKTITTIFILLLVSVFVAGLLWLIVYFCGNNVTDMVISVENWVKNMGTQVHTLSLFLQTKLGIDGKEMEGLINCQLNEWLFSIKQGAFSGIMKNSVMCMQKLVPVMAFFGIYLIATILFSKDFDKIMERVHGFGALDLLMNTINEILHTIGAYLKSQAIILLAICLFSAIALRLCGISYAYFLGILAGILDALPFIGTGIVLIPVAVIYLIDGKILKAVFCVLIYIACIGIRELLEPRLMGKRLGIYPVLLLLSIYAGVKLFGISGIIKGPFGIVLYRYILKMILGKGVDK